MFARISYPGIAGAYSHLAVQTLAPHSIPIPCLTFAKALQAVDDGLADAALLPIENSTAGRVMELYSRLPDINLHIVAEHYQPIHHCLHGAGTLEEVTDVYSHPQALAQCMEWLEHKGFNPIPVVDTAAAVQDVARSRNHTQAAIAGKGASVEYGLNILAEDIQDKANNTTRFILFAPHAAVVLPQPTEHCKTVLLLDVNNKPAALANILMCFAKEALNLVKLESYMDSTSFKQARFFIEIEGHTASSAMQNALHNIAEYTQKQRILGCYVAKTPAMVK